MRSGDDGMPDAGMGFVLETRCPFHGGRCDRRCRAAATDGDGVGGIGRRVDARTPSPAQVVGGGDVMKGLAAMMAVADALAAARRKHPRFAENDPDAWEVIADELEELRAEIVGDGTRERRREEAMDVLVTALRFWLGEQDHAGGADHA